MGKIKVDGEEIWEDVLLAKNMNYNIDSEFQLVEVNGWTKDLSIKDPRVKRYTKGNRQRLYQRDVWDTHMVLVNSLNLNNYELVLHKMRIVHENLGHKTPRELIYLAENYSERHLGYTKEEALIYSKMYDCKVCKETKGLKKGKMVIYTDYKLYGNREGIHLDVFYCYGLTFLLLKSHQHE